VESNWIPHSKRPEWKDVIPIYLTDEENSAVRIAYSEKFGETFAFVRAILQTDEKSPRAFDLTSEALQLNPANYTVWNFRRVLLKFLKFDLKNELDFISETIFENPKNYQVWHHRKFFDRRNEKSDPGIKFHRRNFTRRCEKLSRVAAPKLGRADFRSLERRVGVCWAFVNRRHSK